MDIQFEVDQIKHVLDKLVEFFHIKMIFAAIFIFLSKTMDGSSEIVMTIAVLLAFDTATGSLFALKNKFLARKGLYNGPAKDIFNSRGIYRGPFKFTVYFSFILISRLVDKHIAFPFASPAIDAFIVTTEAYSIFENFAKLGFAAPTTFLEKLKGLAQNKKSE